MVIKLVENGIRRLRRKNKGRTGRSLVLDWRPSLCPKHRVNNEIRRKKLSFKFTARRPTREEELVQIKGEIAAKRPQKGVCIREVEQTKDSYLIL